MVPSPAKMQGVRRDIDSHHRLRVAVALEPGQRKSGPAAGIEHVEVRDSPVRLFENTVGEIAHAFGPPVIPLELVEPLVVFEGSDFRVVARCLHLCL